MKVTGRQISIGVLVVFTVGCLYFAATRFVTLPPTIYSHATQELTAAANTGIVSAASQDRIINPVLCHCASLTGALVLPLALWIFAFIVQSRQNNKKKPEDQATAPARHRRIHASP